MAITGKRFLELNRVDNVLVSEHAVARLHQWLGFEPTKALASIWFRRARHLKDTAIFDEGYRPAYSRRVEDGYQSWYFLFTVFGQECVAVISRRGKTGPLIWITTYAPNTQTFRFRTARAESVAA